jgi:hypothetical protein
LWGEEADARSEFKDCNKDKACEIRIPQLGWKR